MLDLSHYQTPNYDALKTCLINCTLTMSDSCSLVNQSQQSLTLTYKDFMTFGKCKSASFNFFHDLGGISKNTSQLSWPIDDESWQFNLENESEFDASLIDLGEQIQIH